MRALKRTKVNFWGHEYTVHPMLLDAVFGDGKEFVWFEYMDDRPCYYIARVPTGTQKEKGYPAVINDIEDAIRDEAMDFYSERAWREHDRKGYVSTNRRWPIPPGMASGSAWGSYEPPEHVLAMCNDPSSHTAGGGSGGAQLKETK